MISEAERLSRELYTAAAEHEAVYEEIGLDKVISYANQFLELDTTDKNDGLILIMVGHSLVAGEFGARQFRAIANNSDESEATTCALDWITSAALDLISTGLDILSKDTGVPTNPQDYIPDELGKPSLH